VSDLAFENLNEIIFMDGHGIYVWPVYAIGIFMIFISFFIAKKKIRDVQKKVKIKNASS
jgi:heme exporter protein D